MNVSETLNRAADLIEERGWGRGANTWDGGSGGALCLEGAIGAAMGRAVNRYCGNLPHISPDEIQLCPAGAVVREYLSDFFASDPEAWLCHWNDRQTDPVRVVEVLRAAAVVEAARESAPASVAVSA